LRKRSSIVALIAFSVTLPIVTPEPAGAEATITRIAGADRFTTAALISQHTFDAATLVYVASGERYADALAATPVGAAHDAPVLLAVRDDLPGPTATELSRLKPERIVVVGGSGAISDHVLDLLKGYAPTVERIAGADRYATATLLTASTFQPGAPLFVASGEAFPDALAGGATAGRSGGALLLVPRDSLPNSVATEADRLKPASITVLGGAASVSDAVVDTLRGHTSGAVSRISGTDRYATSAAISQAAGDADTIVLATGSGFADALAGGVAAAAENAPVLLGAGTCLTPAVADEVARLAPTKILILGGTAALARTVDALVRCPGASQFTVQEDGSATVTELAFVYNNLSFAQQTWGDSGPITLRVTNTRNSFNPPTPGAAYVHGVDIYVPAWRDFASFGENAQFNVVVHEYFHTLQQWLARRGTGQLLAPSGAAPVWLVEGSPAYLAGVLEAKKYNQDLKTVMAAQITRAKKTSAALCSIQTYDDLYGHDDTDGRLALILVAAGNLVDRFGETPTVNTVWSKMGAGSSFATAFQDAYGRSEPTFCSEFESERAKW
jgi:putative cell wall-binding protein